MLSPSGRGVRSRIFKSRLARRIFSLFVLSTLVPLLLFAAFSLREVTDQLETQARVQLHEACKAVGMSAIERIDHLHEDLAQALRDGSEDALDRLAQASRRTRTRFDARFAWAALGTLESEVLGATKEGVELPRLTPEEREHLLSQGALLLFPVNPDGTLRLILAVTPRTGRPDRLLFGEVRSSFLFSGETVWHQPNSSLLVLTEDGLPIYGTNEGRSLQSSILEAKEQNSANGSYLYRAGDESQVVVYRTMFTRPRFFRNFVLAQSQPLAFVLAPARTFKKMFLLFGLLTLSTIVAASLVQIRRSLLPIVLLREGTRRLAAGSSEDQVEIHSNDEFEELARSFNFMSARIRERTTALELANRAKADFLANMSHEIRTPLTAVLGYAELSLSEDATDDDRRRHLEIIHRNGSHLLQVVNEILDMSQVESGQIPIRSERCAAARIVADIVRLLEVTARRKGIELLLEQGPELAATAQTDPMRLRQILMNIIGNAVKYTERGQVLVRTELGPRSGQDGHVFKVSVRDSGPGIADEDKQRIFDAFYQVDTSMSRRHGGTGLGLALARKLARLLGGDIECESRLGKGSEFTLTIDAGQPEVAAPLPAASEAPSSPAEVPAPAPPSGARILLVEDVAVNRRLVATVLKRTGVEVHEAENGKVGFEKARAAWTAGAPYAVILMDMQMPEMDGYEATRLLREAGYREPIIALTAHSLDGERARCLAAGCDDFATKPIDRKALLEKVADYMARRATT
jgi:signal transduction histidine kinase/CheY-like chemotaxis protein